ncbi:MAG: bile acid:sodium symporter family protein, partial [Myxococcota bacterium]
VALDPAQMALNVGLLLAVPCAIGMLTARYAPATAARLRRPMRIASLVFFVIVVAAAFASNWEVFLVAIATVAGPVALLNALALGTGWTAGGLAGLDGPDRRAVTVEVGIQNSGLGLVLIFNFFEGLGGMAIVAGWWGIWHIIAGLMVAGFWNLRDRRVEVVA